MSLSSLLIANRGEIAIRVMRAAAEMGIRTVAVFSEDDAHSLHTLKADEARRAQGRGRRGLSRRRTDPGGRQEAGCEAIHPGYGFLSENAAFARRCAEEAIMFVGPRPEILELFGDKVQARALAGRCGVPVLAGTSRRGQPRAGQGVFRVAGRRRRGDDQGGRRRRRPRHARRASRWRTSTRPTSAASPRRAPLSATATSMSSS